MKHRSLLKITSHFILAEKQSRQWEGVKMKRTRRKKKWIVYLAICVVCCAISSIGVEFTGYRQPDEAFVPLDSVLNQETFSDADYDLLFHQTGLGRAAVDEILEQEDGKETILRFQENFLSPIDYECGFINPLTREENIIDKATGDYKPGFELAPHRRGDVLVSISTHTLGFRHGHAAIVTGENTTIESIMLGYNSIPQDIDKWRYYTTFMMLRLKGAPQETLDEIVDYTLEYLSDKPYTPFTGLLTPKNPPIDLLTATQCAHLVWYPFKQFGYDIDANKGWLVTPRDIGQSDLFEIVQIFGLDPDRPL